MGKIQKYIIIISILIIGFLNFIKAEKIALIKNIDFKIKTEKVNELRNAFYDFMLSNLKNSKLEIDTLACEKLGQLYLRHNSNFFQASRNLFTPGSRKISIKEDTLTQKMAIERKVFFKDINKTIYGNLDIKGTRLYLNLMVYSKNDRRIILNREFRGSTKKFIEFCFETTTVLLNTLSDETRIVNSFTIDENAVLLKYLKAKKYYENNEFYKAVDLLEFLEKYYIKYPFIKEMSQEIATKHDFNLKNGIFQTPLENRTRIKAPRDDRFTAVFRKIFGTGYRLRYVSDQMTKNEDSTTVNLTLTYTLEFKPFAKYLLKKEIKKNKGDLKFSKLNRYRISSNEGVKKKFSNLLNSKVITYSFRDKDDEVLFKTQLPGNSFADNFEAKSIIFPVSVYPESDNLFTINKKTSITFRIKDVLMEKVKKIDHCSYEIEFIR